MESDSDPDDPEPTCGGVSPLPSRAPGPAESSPGFSASVENVSKRPVQCPEPVKAGQELGPRPLPRDAPPGRPLWDAPRALPSTRLLRAQTPRDALPGRRCRLLTQEGHCKSHASLVSLTRTGAAVGQGRERAVSKFSRLLEQRTAVRWRKARTHSGTGTLGGRHLLSRRAGGRRPLEPTPVL